MKLILENSKWVNYKDVYYKGLCWGEKDTPLKSQDLARKLYSLDNLCDLIDFIKGLNGLYAIIINKPKLRLLAVDKTRIYPLFYRIEKEDFTISDLPCNLKMLGDEIDKYAKAEYLSTGAPLQGKTLIKGINQVEPGYVYEISDGKIKKTEIYSYTVLKHEIRTKDIIFEQEYLWQNIERTFDRLINSLNNRQVVIPLSGGYDSRLILCMLKRKGYTNLVCYTVGPNFPQEQNIAIKIAKELNVPIYHIDYKRQEFVTQEFRSKEFLDMIDFVGSFGNFLWLFEYNAIKWLKNNNLIKEDAIFIPGHCGDFIAGSHLQKNGIKERETIISARNKLLLNSFEYYRPYRNKQLREYLSAYFEKRYKLGKLVYSIALDFILKNRLAHQINNSSRLYEFMGYSVRLPLWDQELTEYFRCLDYKLLYKKRLYDKVIQEKLFIKMNVSFKMSINNNSRFRRQHLFNYIKQFVSRKFYIKHKGSIDILGETDLTKEMVDEMVEAGIMQNKEDFISQNEIMLKWYLMRVENQCNKKVIKS